MTRQILRNSAFAALFLTLFGAAPLRAQGQSSVAMRLDLVAWGDDIHGLTLKSGKKKKTITALAFRYSDPVSYSGPALLKIHQAGAGGPVAEDTRDIEGSGLGGDDTAHPRLPTRKELAAQEKDVPPLLAKLREDDPSIVALVKLPFNSRRATVLLAPGPADTYQAHVINDDPRKLPIGRLRVHNLSPLTVAMRFGGAKKLVQLKPRQSIVVPPKNGYVVYELAYKENGAWEVQENNMIQVKPNEQAQFIILKSTNSYFMSSSGSMGGYLQHVLLKREPNRRPPSTNTKTASQP
jgi:hypothetical protein